MYNRYIPQPDGSYRRNRVPDPRRPSVQQKSGPQSRPPQPEPSKPCRQDPPRQEACPPPKPTPCPPPAPEPCPCPIAALGSKPRSDTVGGFLRRLLPKDFDTGDLFVVILLLLMAGDSAEDKNTALLTLALYFFM